MLGFYSVASGEQAPDRQCLPTDLFACAGLTERVDKTYDIQGTAAHTHSFTVTAAMFAELAANMAAGATTTVTLAHQHAITVACV